MSPSATSRSTPSTARIRPRTRVRGLLHLDCRHGEECTGGRARRLSYGRSRTETLSGKGCSSFLMAATGTRVRLPALAFASGCACLIAAVAAIAGSDRAGARANAVVIGQTPVRSPTARPRRRERSRRPGLSGDGPGDGLPDDGRRAPQSAKVRRSGNIVAWGVDVSKPTKRERRFFEEALANSGPPSARLSILKPKDGDPSSSSSRVPWSSSRPCSATGRCSRSPTAARPQGHDRRADDPDLLSTSATPATTPDAWRASREEGQCLNAQDLLKRSRPQQKVGGSRHYACTYEGARILYRAYLAPQ